MKTPVKISITSGSLFFSETNQIESGANGLLDEPIPANAVDLAVDIALPNTAGRLKLFAMKALTAPLTIKIANGAGALIEASATITLAAEESYIWPVSAGDPAPAWFDAGDIEKLLVTNDSPTVQGQLQAILLWDPTA